MNTRVLNMILAGAVLVASPAAGQQIPPNPSTPQTKPQTATPAIASSDAQFLIKTSESNLAEVECSTLAASKAQNEQVKAYASKLLTDHQENQAELQALASRKSVSVPSEPPAAKKAAKEKLAKLEGVAFDKAYLADMIKGHKQAISAFERAATSPDPEIKTYAEKTLPALKDHLAQAQAIKITAPSRDR